MRRNGLVRVILFASLLGTSPMMCSAGDLAPLPQRFSGDGPLPDEVPDFQKHISPLMGRLGCNGRACHGSFQGRGGFRLSLFGYDFKADHEAMFEKDTGRIDLDKPLESLILTKPADADIHEGGKRFDVGSWQQRVLRKWVESGAPYDRKIVKLKALEVEPRELLFSKQGQTAQLKAVAVWEDGTREVVTDLCRFQSNDTSLVEIDERGAIKSGESQGDSHVVVFYDNAVIPVPVIRPVSEKYGDRYPQVAASTEVDRLIINKLRKVGIVPSDRCDDATYVRRVYLDLAGTLPTEKEVRDFLADKSPNKRQDLVEKLFNTEGYNALWTTRLCDWTGNNSALLQNSTPNNTSAALWYEWIYKRVADNTPYDQIVEGLVDSHSRNDGEDYEQFCSAMSDACRKPELFASRESMPFYWARNNFRTAEDRAVGFAYSFLGIRIQCAQCHKHPFDQWSKDDFEKFQKLFTQVQLNGQNIDTKGLAGSDREFAMNMLEKVGGSGLKGNDLRRKIADELKAGGTVPFAELTVRVASTKVSAKPQKENEKRAKPAAGEGELLGGGKVSLAGDTREQLMAWMREPNNPFFSKALVNRVWAHYFGSGIVSPSDDLNLANPPRNAELLDWLAKGFVENKFDMRWLHRTIIASDTYQRSWEANETNVHDRRNFSRFQPRRLPAEVLYDAVTLATTSDQKQERLISDGDDRALHVYNFDPKRTANDKFTYALGVFGRSTRESNCDCDRSEDPSLLQTVFLRNDKDVLQSISSADGWAKQVCGIKPEAAKNNDPDTLERRIAQIEDQMDSYAKQIKRQKSKDGNDAAIKKLQVRYEAMERQVKQWKEQLAEATDPKNRKGENYLTSEMAKSIVESAYLRTLSRPATEEEMGRSMQFLLSSQTATEGVEGLVWALINTKEFALNH